MNYHSIWRKFNQFVIKLDDIPQSWEQKLKLYCSHLVVDLHLQSSTVRSYASAIKQILISDGYTWNNDLFLMSIFTHSCKLKNDRLKCRLPIQKGLLEMILYELEEFYTNQNYLNIMYRSLFLDAYYGLLRIGELTDSQHVIKLGNVHIAQNDNRVLFVLYTSKTHGLRNRPQKIRLDTRKNRKRKERQSNFCPVDATYKYLQIRAENSNNIPDVKDQFFVFSDGTKVKAQHVRKLLRKLIKRLDLNPSLYDTHSFRIGRATDLLKYGYGVDEIKKKGRWKSNAVFNYLRD